MRAGRRRFLKLAAAAAAGPFRGAAAQRKRSLVDGAGRRIGLRWLARILYPQAFPEDPRPIVRDFYTRCLHQGPSEAQLDQLVRAPGPAGA